MNLKKALAATVLAGSAMSLSLPTLAADYVIDTAGAHAFVNFKVKHLGYSWLHGRFNDFNGTFSFDSEDPSNSQIEVTIKTTSVDSNHAERDKHLRGDDFLDVAEFPEARFVSTRIETTDGEKATIYGNFTLKNITKEIAIDAVKMGEGSDPWGGYRAGFSGTTTLAMDDFDMMDLGPAAANIEITLEVEGIRQ